MRIIEHGVSSFQNIFLFFPNVFTSTTYQKEKKVPPIESDTPFKHKNVRLIILCLNVILLIYTAFVLNEKFLLVHKICTYLAHVVSGTICSQ